MRWVIATAVIAMAACSTEPPHIREHWHRENTTEQQFGADYYACMKDAQQQRTEALSYQGTGSLYGRTVINRTMFTACMSVKGYAQSEDGMKPHKLRRPDGFEPVLMVNG